MLDQYRFCTALCYLQLLVNHKMCRCTKYQSTFSGISHILNHFYMTFYLNLSCKISIHAIYPSILAFSCLIKEYLLHLIKNIINKKSKTKYLKSTNFLTCEHLFYNRFFMHMYVKFLATIATFR